MIILLNIFHCQIDHSKHKQRVFIWPAEWYLDTNAWENLWHGNAFQISHLQRNIHVTGVLTFRLSLTCSILCDQAAGEMRCLSVSVTDGLTSEMAIDANIWWFICLSLTKLPRKQSSGKCYARSSLKWRSTKRENARIYITTKPLSREYSSNSWNCCMKVNTLRPRQMAAILFRRHF